MRSNTEKILASFLSRGISASYRKNSPVISVDRGCISQDGESPQVINDLKKEIESETDTRIYWCKNDDKRYYIKAEAR